MPEYLAPGVFVKEVSSRNRSIEGVATSTAGFVGPCRSGPVGGEPELLTSTADFERIYGAGEPLQFSDISIPVENYLAHAVRAFFEEGGSRCYVSRIVNGSTDDGGDGNQPGPADYAGAVGVKTGLRSFERLEEISMVAAPGASFDYAAVGGSTHAEAVAQCLIAHCEKMRYRVAVIDSVNGHDTGEVGTYRSTFDSKYAALYYPWITILNPLTGNNMAVPPSGSICGIYARVDASRGVHKAPANEVIRLAIGLEASINRQQQSILNPLGINCLRYFGRRGYRVWGARTAGSDPEFKYINVSRYFAYLQHSIDRGTQWTVFENNGVGLWGKVRRTIEDFLFNEWKQGCIAGSKPGEAYYVRCDRTTMTQHDIDNGRLICLVGVAAVRPAEFVIFHIGQKTADSI